MLTIIGLSRSCLGKRFTAVLNSRLTAFLNSNEILLENQAGFRSDMKRLIIYLFYNRYVKYLHKENKISRKLLIQYL